MCFFFFSSRRRHTRFDCDWSSDVCSSDLDFVLRFDAKRNHALCATTPTMEKLVLHRNHRLLTKLSPGHPIAEHLRRWHRAKYKEHGRHHLHSLWRFGLAENRLSGCDPRGPPPASHVGFDRKQPKALPVRQDHANRQRQFPSGHFAARANTLESEVNLLCQALG